MSFVYSTGYRFNALSTALSVVASSEDADFTVDAIMDNRLSVKYKSAATSPVITANLDILINGNFDTSVLASWTESVSGGGSTSEEATIVVSGKSLKLTTSGASSAASRYQDVILRAGKKYNISAMLRGDGTRSARLRLYFPEYGSKYIDNTGAISASPVDIGSNSATSFSSYGCSFYAPSASDMSGRHEVLARVVLINNTASSGSAYADNVALWPSWDLVSVHGHNIPGGTDITITSSTDNFSSFSSAGSMTVRPHRFYMLRESLVNDQYFRISFTTAVDKILEITEIVVTASDTLQKGFKWPYKLQIAHDQTRTQLGSGIKSYKTRTMPRLTLSMDWTVKNLTQLSNIVDDMMVRSGHGHYPILIIPDSSDDVVVFGRLPNQSVPSKERDLSSFNLIVVEMPYARI